MIAVIRIKSLSQRAEQPTARTFQILTASSQATRSPWCVSRIILITLFIVTARMDIKMSLKFS